MKRTTKFAGIALAATLVCSTAVPALAAGRFGTGEGIGAGNGVCVSQGWCEGNDDGVCANGACENAGQGQGQGLNRVDANGDGVCDNAGTGTCDGTGTGTGTCSGTGAGTGTCAGTGTGAGMGHGCRAGR